MARKPDGLYDRHDFVAGQKQEIGCDVVVVGSGAGGAVMAAELAEGGLNVVVVEEGGYHPTESFDGQAAPALRRLYRDGGAMMAFGSPPVILAEGRAVGGSTLINGGMSWRTPERILERWDLEEACERVRPADMAPYFERVERFISASRQDPETVGRDNALLRLGAERQGWKVVDNVRNQVHCAGTNNCAFGCPTGAKRSTLVSYVPRALAFGARVYADCRVDRILFHGKRAVGVEGKIALGPGRGHAPLRVRAKRVVVAGGALQTPALLHRSGFRSPSGQLGRALTLHPNVKVVALFDEPVEGWKGVHQAYQVREFKDEGIVMAAVNVPPGLISMSLPSYGGKLASLMRCYDRMVIAGLLVEDTITGHVRTVLGRPIPFYQLTAFDVQRLIRGTALLCELLFAAGARRIVLPFEGVPDLRSPDDVRRLMGQRIAAGGIEVVTVHMMGTARMGGDPTRHVTDSFGRVHDADQLYVADASLFPTPIGVNPMETIMALATRNAERLLDGWPG